MKTNKGFTLIELLVVIAIIGILSSVVLASLNTARDKGADAALKANLSGVRAQAELVYDDEPSCYGDGDGTGCFGTAIAPGECVTNVAQQIFSNANVASAITSATDVGGGLNACSAAAGMTAWAIVVQSKEDPLVGFCVDSSGQAKEVTIATDNQAGLTAEVDVAGACVE